MRKEKKEIEVTICDGCGKGCDHYSIHPCTGTCGKGFCYSCLDLYVKTYPHAVHFSGSSDGEYCLDCDVKLVNDPKHKAYVTITNLRNEANGWYKDFEVRTKEAENKLKKFIAQ